MVIDVEPAVVVNPTSTTDIFQKITLAGFSLGIDVPYCPTTGKECIRQARKGMWICEESGYSITTQSWDFLLLHAEMAKHRLESHDMKLVLFEGTTMELDEACGPGHLLPAFVSAALRVTASANLRDMFMLDVVEITDQAYESGCTLTPFMVTVSNPAAQLTESLSILLATIDQAVKAVRENDPWASVFDYRILAELIQISEVA